MSTMNAAPDNKCLKAYTATAPLSAKHFAALVEGMDYHVQLSVDRAKLRNVTIHTTDFSQRSRKMMMNQLESES